MQNVCKICSREDDFPVDLEKRCKMRPWLQRSASIQPRTSPGKSDVSWLHSWMSIVEILGHGLSRRARERGQGRPRAGPRSRSFCRSAYFYSEIRGNLVVFFFGFGGFLNKKRCKGIEKSRNSGLVQRKNCTARKTLQNDALDAKIGVDAAVNEPLKV